MSLNFKSLSGLDDLVAADGEHFVLVKTPEGFKDLKVTDLQVFINGTVIPRIENLEDNPLTSTWPIPRKLSLAGPFTGEVFLDGRQDEVLTVSVPTNALPTSAINGLPTLLLNLSNAADDHETRLGAAETSLINKLDVTAAAISAAKWSNSRSITLIGLASGSVLIDGSADVSLNVTGLSVTKVDVGLDQVDNTSDINKPVSNATQTALNSKLNVGGAAADYMGSAPAYYDSTAAVDVNNFLGGSRALVAKENANVPPAGEAFWYIETIKTYTSAVNLFQRAYGYQSAEIWTRYCFGGTWSGWRRQWDSVNFDPSGKADLAGSPVFDGTVTAKGGSVYAQAPTNASNANYWLRDETGANQGVLFWDRLSDTVRLRRYNAGGTGIEGELALGAASASINGYDIWTAETFDPATKLDTTATAAAAIKLATPRNFSLTGVVTAAAVSFNGTGNVALATAIADNALLISKTIGLQAALDGKSSTSHNHDTLYVRIPNSSPSSDPDTIGGTLSHTVIGSPVVNTPATYMTVWNFGTAGNRDGQIGWRYVNGAEDFYMRSRYNVDGTWNAWVKLLHDGNFDPTTKVDTSSVSAASGANTIAQRNSANDLVARLFRAEYNDQTTMSGAIAFRINSTTDNYMRYCNSPTAVRDWLGVGTGNNVTFNRIIMGVDPGINNSIGCSGWFRSSGNSGWFNQTWGIGIYATDGTWVRTYNAGGFAAPDFVISSDRSLKDGIRPLEYRGRLRPVHYRHRETGKTEFGFIAQEVQELYPEVVGQIREEGRNDPILQLSYSKLTAVLSHQINALEDEIGKLREVIERQQTQIQQLLISSKRSWWKRLLGLK